MLKPPLCVVCFGWKLFVIHSLTLTNRLLLLKRALATRDPSFMTTLPLCQSRKSNYIFLRRFLSAFTSNIPVNVAPDARYFLFGISDKKRLLVIPKKLGAFVGSMACHKALNENFRIHIHFSALLKTVNGYFQIHIHSFSSFENRKWNVWNHICFGNNRVLKFLNIVWGYKQNVVR